MTQTIRYFSFVVMIFLFDYSYANSKDVYTDVLNQSIISLPDKEVYTRYNSQMLDSIDRINANPIEAYIATAKYLAENGHTASSLLIIDKIIEDLNDSGDFNVLFDAYIINGVNYRELGNIKKALEYFQAAEKVAKASNNYKHLARCYNYLFSIYYITQEYDNAETLLLSALKINIRNNDSVEVRKNYNNLGLLKYENGDFQEAVDYMQRALSFTDSTDFLDKSLIHTNIAEVYYSKGEYLNAERELTMIFNQDYPSVFSTKLIQSKLNMALVKARLGKRKEALALQKELKKLIDEVSPTAQVNAYRQLSDISFVLGDSLLGLRCLLEYERKRLDIKEYERDNQLRQLLVAYDTERLQQKNLQLESSLKFRNTIVIGCAIFAIALIIFILLLYRHNKIIRSKSRLISEQQKQLLIYRQQEHERQQREMSLLLDYKNRQLTSYSIDLDAGREFHLKIKESLEDVKKRIRHNPDGAVKDILEIMRKLEMFNSDQMNEDFRKFFDEVHPYILEKLSVKFPQLNQLDLRLCAYLYLGMNTKEIAALTFREVRSVESQRYRLRKKLGISSEVDFKKFFNDVVND